MRFPLGKVATFSRGAANSVLRVQAEALDGPSGRGAPRFHPSTVWSPNRAPHGVSVPALRRVARWKNSQPLATLDRRAIAHAPEGDDDDNERQPDNSPSRPIVHTQAVGLP